MGGISRSSSSRSVGCITPAPKSDSPEIHSTKLSDAIAGLYDGPEGKRMKLSDAIYKYGRRRIIGKTVDFMTSPTDCYRGVVTEIDISPSGSITGVTVNARKDGVGAETVLKSDGTDIVSFPAPMGRE